MDQIPQLDEEEMKYRFQAMIRAEHATYAAYQRPRYVQLIRRIEQIVGNKLKKESGDYRILKRFEVHTIDGEKRLMKKKTGKMFVCTDELFEIIKKGHADSGQKGESKTLRELAKTYANITRDQVKAFLHLCSCPLCVRTKVQAAKTSTSDLDFASETDFIESCALPSDAGACSPPSFCESLVKKELPNEDDVHIHLPSTSNGDAGAYSPHSFCEALVKNKKSPNEDNVQAHAQNSVVTNDSPVPLRRKRGRPRNAENVNALRHGGALINGSSGSSVNANTLAQKRVAPSNRVVPIRKKRGRPRLVSRVHVDALKQCEVLMNEDDAGIEFNDSCNTEPSHGIQFEQVNGHRPVAVGDAIRNTLDDTEEPIHAESVGACLQQLAECQRQLLYVESRRLAIEEVRLQVDQQVAASLLEIVNHLKQNNDKTSN